MMDLSSLRHIGVFDTSSAESVGRVEAVLIDAGEHRVDALLVGGGNGDDLVLPWSAVKAVGPDAVTVGSHSDLRPVSDAERRTLDGDPTVIAKLALTDGGDEIGIVGEVRLSEKAGVISEIQVGEWTVKGTGLVGVGDYAVVVEAEALN